MPGQGEDYMETSTLTMLLAGGAGTRLFPLTATRAKPSVPYGGRYRIIDFALNNLLNSGFYRINVLVQFKSDSLIKHITQTYQLSRLLDQYVDIIPAQMKRGDSWYKGTADAVYQNLNLIEDCSPQHTLIFAGDHVYKMNIRQMLNYHLRKDADVTIAAVPQPKETAHSFGIIQVDDDWRVIGFEEKPKENPKTMPSDPSKVLVSMGNYIWRTDVLIDELKRDAPTDSAHDFGRTLLPNLYKSHKLYVYDFVRNTHPGMTEAERGYWRDVGSIESYWESNMELVSVSPAFNLYNREWPLRTPHWQLPPAKFVFADKDRSRLGIATDSLVSEGCIISGGHINRTILFPSVRINSFSYITDSLIMDGSEVGRYARIKRAIIDKNVYIGPHVVIGYDPKEDRRRFHVSPGGIVVIPKGEKIEAEKKAFLPVGEIK
jgi:glucose-1-phosphate adenylyltransferase